MPPPDTLTLIAAIFLLAGVVKGVIGLGLPTVALALLTATVGLTQAMALLLVPSFVTNLWQALAGGALRQVLRRTWPTLLAAALCTGLGARVLGVASPAGLTALLGALLAAYALLGLSPLRLPPPGRHERWLAPAVGAVNGVLTGMTGSFVVPGVPWLQSLGLPREAFVQAMGVLFTVSTVALAAALGDRRLLSLELAGLSAAGLLPALAGMALGQRLRRRLSEAAFRRTFFAGLLLLGLWIAARALAGGG